MFFASTLLSLSACNGAGPNSNKTSDNGLELLYFGKPLPEENAEPAPQTLKKNAFRAPIHYNANDVNSEEGQENKYEYEVTYHYPLTLEAYVRNTNRLSFVDAVIYSASTNKKYVFTTGFGDYSLRASTILSNGIWTTKLEFDLINWEIVEQITDSCTFDTYLEIEEINFLNLSGTVTSTNIAENDIKRVDIHATDGMYSLTHSWSEWEHVDRTCEEYEGRVHHCNVCGISVFETVLEYLPKNELENLDLDTVKPLGHIYNGEWEIINNTPGVLQGIDIFQSIGRCERCNNTISQQLSATHDLGDLSYDLVISNDIKEICPTTFFCFLPLKTVRIPKSVKIISTGAFAGCDNLTDVYFESSVPPAIDPFDEQLFYPVWDTSSDFKIHVPTDALEAYQNIDNKKWQYSAVPHLVADIPVA